MTKPKLIDLLREPNQLKVGDVIGFNHFPDKSAKMVEGSSRLTVDKFAVGEDKPRYRGFVLHIIYDSQKNDRIEGMVVLPLAPFDKTLRMNNDEKNLMITNHRQIGSTNLDANKNWRVNYTPVNLQPNRKNFGTDQDFMVHRIGSTPHTLDSLILAQGAQTIGNEYAQHHGRDRGQTIKTHAGHNHRPV